MSNPYTNRQRVKFTITPVTKTFGMITVSSVNQHGYQIITEHGTSAGAQHERDMREERGHTEVK